MWISALDTRNTGLAGAFLAIQILFETYGLPDVSVWFVEYCEAGQPCLSCMLKIISQPGQNRQSAKSLEASTIIRMAQQHHQKSFPSIVSNALIVVSKHNASPPKAQLRNCFTILNQRPRSTTPMEHAASAQVSLSGRAWFAKRRHH